MGNEKMGLVASVDAKLDAIGDVYKRQALYTPPVTPWELGAPEASEVTERSQLSKVRPMTGVKS